LRHRPLNSNLHPTCVLARRFQGLRAAIAANVSPIVSATAAHLENQNAVVSTPRARIARAYLYVANGRPSITSAARP
jgi:hypothetical protein